MSALPTLQAVPAAPRTLPANLHPTVQRVLEPWQVFDEDLAFELAKQFHAQGFTIIRAAVSVPACKRLRAKINEWVPYLTSLKYNTRNITGRRFSLNHASWATQTEMHEVLTEIFLGQCRMVLNLITGNDATIKIDRIGGDASAPGCDDMQEWHSDWKDLDLPECILCADIGFGVAVQEVARINGPMRILPHDCGRAQADANAYYCEMKTGDVLLRNIRTLHSGTPNTSLEYRFIPGGTLFTKVLHMNAGVEQQATVRVFPSHYKEQVPIWLQSLFVFKGDAEESLLIPPVRIPRKLPMEVDDEEKEEKADEEDDVDIDWSHSEEVEAS